MFKQTEGRLITMCWAVSVEKLKCSTWNIWPLHGGCDVKCSEAEIAVGARTLFIDLRVGSAGRCRRARAPARRAGGATSFVGERCTRTHRHPRPPACGITQC